MIESYLGYSEVAVAAVCSVSGHWPLRPSILANDYSRAFICLGKCQRRGRFLYSASKR